MLRTLPATMSLYFDTRHARDVEAPVDEDTLSRGSEFRRSALNDCEIRASSPVTPGCSSREEAGQDVALLEQEDEAQGQAERRDRYAKRGLDYAP